MSKMPSKRSLRAVLGFALLFLLGLDYWAWDSPVHTELFGLPDWIWFFILLQLVLAFALYLFARKDHPPNNHPES